MSDLPYSVDWKLPEGLPSTFDNHIQRRLSSLEGLFLDEVAFGRVLSVQDPLVYEVYEFKRPEIAGELMHGFSIVHPGTVGDEFFMTKGHYHIVLDTAETYYCLTGEGCMVMETPEGEWCVEPLKPGRVLFVPPRWAHRSVNTGLGQDLITYFVYPAFAGHDYGTIENQGFRKLVKSGAMGYQVVDNPRWTLHSRKN